MSNVVGFNTPSKRLAEEQAKNSPQIEAMPVSNLQAEAVMRFETLTDMILSPQFATLPQDQKEMMMVDFAFYKNVAEALN
jgi:hypothetical protein